MNPILGRILFTTCMVLLVLLLISAPYIIGRKELVTAFIITLMFLLSFITLVVIDVRRQVRRELG